MDTGKQISETMEKLALIRLITVAEFLDWDGIDSYQCVRSDIS